MYVRWLLLVALAAAGCGWRAADEQVLHRFFERSRVYDRTMLAEVATVAFNPRVDGIVEEFELLERRQDASAGVGRRQIVTLRADVRTPGGALTSRTLLVTMEERDGRWMVTGFQ